jgi:hypothetical protein
VNGVGTKDQLPDDVDGAKTLSYLRSVQKSVDRITSTAPASLGLHPLVYFYTRSGAFQPVAFLAVMQLVKKLDDKRKLDDFTRVRREFEDFIVAHKEAFTLIVKSQGSGGRSRPALEDFMWQALEGLWARKNDQQIIEGMASDNRFRFFATPAPIRTPATSSKRSFSTSTKSAVFVADLVKNGARCGVCQGLLHRNSIQTDHITRKADGGGAHIQNGQLTHPYCNSTYKERSIALASGDQLKFS